tara:strand:+ start:161 stop:532 length:372 start_codon:yes stop_codon:yes gene_type:complete
MYELRVESDFSAAHQLREYQGSCENLHGHNWKVEVAVKMKELNDIGIGLDFRAIRQVTQDLLASLDHQFLNELEPFQEINATSENLAHWLFQELGQRLNAPGIEVSKVTVMETDRCSAAYWEE